MKVVFVMVCMLSLSACSTIGGAMQGAGEDLNRAGEYVRSVGK
jgi:predicted small secreted protein